MQLYNLARDGQWDAAMDLQRRLWSINQVFAKYSLAACVKGGLELMGIPAGTPLPPQPPLTDAGREEVRSVLETLGVMYGSRLASRCISWQQDAYSLQSQDCKQLSPPMFCGKPSRSTDRSIDPAAGQLCSS